MNKAEQGAAEESKIMAGGILIFGATRGTGLAATEILASREERVTVMVRPGSDRSGLEPLGVNKVT